MGDTKFAWSMEHGAGTGMRRRACDTNAHVHARHAHGHMAHAFERRSPAVLRMHSVCLQRTPGPGPAPPHLLAVELHKRKALCHLGRLVLRHVHAVCAVARRSVHEAAGEPARRYIAAPPPATIDVHRDPPPSPRRALHPAPRMQVLYGCPFGQQPGIQPCGPQRSPDTRCCVCMCACSVRPTLARLLTLARLHARKLL